MKRYDRHTIIALLWLLVCFLNLFVWHHTDYALAALVLSGVWAASR